jgi:hypothetical protein
MPGGGEPLCFIIIVLEYIDFASVSTISRLVFVIVPTVSYIFDFVFSVDFNNKHIL